MPVVKKNKSRSAVDEFIQTVESQMAAQGVTNAQLAKKAGVGRAYLYRVLKRDQEPSFSWAEKVAKALGISIDFTATA